MKKLKTILWTILFAALIAVIFTITMLNAGTEGFVRVIETIAGVMG